VGLYFHDTAELLCSAEAAAVSKTRRGAIVRTLSAMIDNVSLSPVHQMAMTSWCKNKSRGHASQEFKAGMRSHEWIYPFHIFATPSHVRYHNVAVLIDFNSVKWHGFWHLRVLLKGLRDSLGCKDCCANHRFTYLLTYLLSVWLMVIFVCAWPENATFPFIDISRVRPLFSKVIPRLYSSSGWANSITGKNCLSLFLLTRLAQIMTAIPRHLYPACSLT